MPEDARESRVADYLRSLGLEPRRFSTAERRGRRTPDFQVYDGGALAFYCEVKAVAPDQWLDQQLAGAPPGVIVGGVRDDPTWAGCP